MPDMLKSATAFTACSILGLAMIGDYKGTIINLSTIVAVRGAGFLTTKIIEGMDKDMKNTINFTSYCLCGVSFIKVLKTAQSTLIPLTR